MSKKVSLAIIIIILLMQIGFILISKGSKSKEKDENLGGLKDNENVHSDISGKNGKMVYIRLGEISSFDKGYYYINEEGEKNNIKYFDYSAKKEIYLCNKPNCKHDTRECSSYLNILESSELFVYNDYLYLISGSGNTETVTANVQEEGLSISNKYGQTPTIYRMNLDGTNKIKLFECPSGVALASSFVFDGNNLYTFFLKSKKVELSKNSYASVETSRELVKINLETKKYEKILDSKNREIIRNI